VSLGAAVETGSREPVENNKWASCPFFFPRCVRIFRAAPGGIGVARITSELVALVERTVAGLGYELVELERFGHGLLRVTLDTPQPGGIGLEDCEKVSRQLTHLFAVEHVDYDRLEVSSPGLDRPLHGRRDFERFAGAEVALQLLLPHQGRRKLRGTVLAVGGEPGAEWLRLRESPPQPAPGKAQGARSKKAPVPELPVFELALAEVDKARLVPQVGFGSKARPAAAPTKESSE
jgi:ribosome maturation factor RimP